MSKADIPEEDYDYSKCCDCGCDLRPSEIDGGMCASCQVTEVMRQHTEYLEAEVERLTRLVDRQNQTLEFVVWPTVEEWEKKTGRVLQAFDVLWCKNPDSPLPWTNYYLYLCGPLLDSGELAVLAIPGLGRPPSTWRPGDPHPGGE